MVLFGVVLATLAVFSIAFIVQKLYLSKTHDLEERNVRLTALRKLDEILVSSFTDLMDVAQKVTDAISFELGFDLGVLALIDDKKRVLRRVAMSNTPTGLQAKKALPLPYEHLEIPLDYTGNISIQAIKEDQKKVTHDLYDLFVPTLSRELSKKIQDTVKVSTSLVYPIKAKGRILGVMIISLAKDESKLSEYEKESIKDLLDVVGVALENAILYQDLKQTTLELEQANSKLKELDKLKDDFVSIASHELRTPMTAIKSYAWMALNRSDIPLTEKLKKYLTRTLLSTERLINLVNDMLNISRIESGRIEVTPKVFDIYQLAQDVIAEVEVKAKEKNLHLQIVPNKIPPVFADPDKVHQVLLNLVGNAMKFTPPYGVVTLAFFSDGQMLDISVKDSGVGISKEDLSRLFQKFGRLDNSYAAAATSGGTGLGLYISKSLVELMGGRIGANSEGLGKGTTFTFSLPIASQAVLANAQKFTRKVEGEVKQLEPVRI